MDSVVNEVSKLDYGCKFGLYKINILAYADDIVIFCNSYFGLELIYKKFLNLSDSHNLKVNVSKSKVMIFCKKRSFISEQRLHLGEDEFEIVSNFNYLGHNISFNLNDENDVKEKLNRFYQNFNMTFRNFKGLNLGGQPFLFNFFATPNYGLQLWNSHNIFNKQIFKTFSISYSSSLKLMSGCPRYASSHLTAEMCNQLLLQHHISKIQLKYYFRFLKHENSIIRLNRIFIKNGIFCSHLNNLFIKRYNVKIYVNPLCALISRINFIQNHERVGRFCNYFNL